MPRKFKVTREVLEGSIHQISVEGELDLSTAPELEAELERAVGDERASVLIDLTACEFIDSSGFAVIVEAWKVQQDQTGDEPLVLCCPTDQVERLLRITGAYDVITIFDDVDEALSSLRPDGKPSAAD